MDILFVNDSVFQENRFVEEEPLFLNPDGTRTTFPIGWEGKGRYLPGSLRLYRTSDNTEIDPATYHEESDGINFTFNTAPASGNYTDIKVKYLINPEDYAFSTGSADSAYPGEEYFLFPNWNNAKGCGTAFWVGKYAAAHADATTSAQGTSTIPVSKKNVCSWTNTTWQAQRDSCPTKGSGFHCIRNREWVSIAMWSDKMGITVYGNWNGYNNTANIDGRGTAITNAIADNSVNHDNKTNVLLRTGMGPATFRHNGKMDGISDLVGNIWEAVDGLQLINGVPHIFAEDNTTLVALTAGDMSTSTTNPTLISYINNSTNDLFNEGLPVGSAGYAVQSGHPGGFWQTRTGTRICYRGGQCNDYNGAGVWALNLANESSLSHWNCGFRLARIM